MGCMHWATWTKAARCESFRLREETDDSDLQPMALIDSIDTKGALKLSK